MSVDFTTPLDTDTSFAIDSDDRIYITRRHLPTLKADKPYEQFSALHWGALKVHARHLICEPVESSILKVVLPKLRHIGGDSECIWALFKDHIGLYHVDKKILVQVTSPGQTAVDGPVLVSPQRTPQSSSATIGEAISFMRTTNYLVILSKEGTIRRLNLATWNLRTLVTLEHSAYSLYPMSISATVLPFVASKDHITLDQGERICNLNLVTGKTSSVREVDLFGSKYDAILPIASSRSAPTYLLLKANQFQMLRIVNGMIQTTFFPGLGRSHRAAHVASNGFSLTTDTLHDASEGAEILSSHETEWQLLQAPARDRLQPFDLSPLINNDIFPNDLIIKHGSQKWKIPLDIVTDLHPSFKELKLNKLIKPFPTASVDALIRRMLGKPLPNAQDIDSCRIWSHVIYLWRLIDDEENPILEEFICFIIPSLPDPVACNTLLDIWNDAATNRTENDPIILSLARHVKDQCLKTFSKLLLSQHSPRNTELALNMIERHDEDTIISEPEFNELGLVAKHLEKTPIPEKGELEALLAKPTDFLFTFDTDDVPYVMIGDTRYLYTRWKWFKRLMDFGGEEKKKRIAKMPEWMSLSVLCAILGHVHEEWFNEVLSVSDALELLEHRHEFDICDADDNPIDPFGELYEHCIDVVFHEVTQDNVLEQIVNYQRLGMVSEVGPLLSLVALSEYQFDAVDLIKVLPLNLLALLKAEVARLEEKPATMSVDKDFSD